MENHSLLLNVLIYLSAAVIAVPIAKRLGLGAVLGYLLAGAVIGPWGFRLITDVTDIMHFAEFGVVLLLFLIGLELNPKRLWEMRKPIVGMGGAQVLASAALIFAVALPFELGWKTALVAAMGLALSSTAIALQSLTEKNLLNTPAGSAGFSILLFQDIAVIPMLAVIPLLGIAVAQPGAEAPWITVLKVVGAILIIVVGGRYLTRPLFRIIANARSNEIFTAFSLMLVIGIALLMESVGLSMALGTFLAGVLLAESEYRHQLETDIDPFKGLLLGLFFISVGMSINFGLLVDKPLLIMLLVLTLVIVKVGVLLVLARYFALPKGQHTIFAFLLSQGGEFAFVLFGVATQNSVLSPDTASLLNVVVAVAMLTTPLLIVVNDRFIAPRFLKLTAAPQEAIHIEEDNPVVIAGFGRFGQIVARLLHANKIGTTVIDHNPNQIERVRRFGFKIYYGDATRLDLLHTAKLDKARILVLAIDDREGAIKTVDLVKEHFPNVHIVARAWDLLHVYEYLDHGVQDFERETFDSALRLGETVLRHMGFGAHYAHLAAQKFRAYDAQLINRLYEVHKDQEQLVTLTQQSREEIGRLFDADEKSLQRDSEQEWG